jgi:hypothetical protein
MEPFRPNSHIGLGPAKPPPRRGMQPTPPSSDAMAPPGRPLFLLWTSPTRAWRSPAVHRLPLWNPTSSCKKSSDYIKPRNSSPTSFFFSSRSLARSMNFIVGVPLVCRCLRPITTQTVSRSPFLSSYSLCLSPAHSPDPFSLVLTAVEWHTRHHPKHITAPPISSRLPLPPLERIDEGDHALEIPSRCRALSWSRRRSEAAGTSPELNQSHLTGLCSSEP